MEIKSSCIVCNKELIGRQRKYCSKQCKSKDNLRKENPDQRNRRQEVQNKRRILNKLRLISHFGGQCSICGYNKNMAALEFHHLNPEHKDFALSQNIDYSYERLLKEVEKCILICSNCHRELHHSDLEIQNFSDIDLNPIEVIKEKRTCNICNNEISPSSRGLCKDCYDKSRVNKNKPSKEELLELIKTTSFLKLGKQFGVSDTVIGRWCKEYELPYLLKDRKLLK